MTQGDSVVGERPVASEIAERIERALVRGHGATILIEGEAGIGKTTLLRELSSAVSDMSIVGATASVLDRGRPFGPLLDALGLGPATVSPELPRAVALQRDELRELLGTQPSEARISPLQLVPAERAHLIERIAGIIEAWSIARPLLLALDDLQWADDSTIATLARLHRLTASQRLVLVVAYRPVPLNPDLRDLVAATTSAGAEMHVVGPFDTKAVRQLVADTIGHVPGQSLLNIAASAGGNPFLILELLRSLDRDGRINIHDGVADLDATTVATRTVVVEIRDAILSRMADLGPETEHLLQVASVLGQSFSAIDVAAMLGRPVAALLPLMSTAVNSGLLEDEDHGLGLRFRHDLVREAIESSIGGSTLAALHLEVARTLAASGAEATRVAAHYALGAQPGDRSAVEWLRTAAAQIVNRAPTSAAQLLERALALTPVGDPERDAVTAELVDAAFWGGQIEQAASLAGTALARPLPPAMEAGLHETMARALVVLGRPSEAVPHADRLVELGGNLAWSLANASVFKLFALDLDGAVTDARRAIAECAEHDDPWAETLAFSVASWEENSRGFHHGAVELADRAVLAADRSPNGAAHRLVPHLFRGLALESDGHTDEAQATLAHGQQLAEALGTAWATPFYHYALALTPWNAGRWDSVQAEIEAGLRYAREHDIGLVASFACGLGATALLYRGDLEGAEALLDEGDQRLAAGGVQYGIDWLLRGRALLLEAKGDAATALATLRLGWDVAEGLKAAAALVVLGPDLVRIAVALGDNDSATLATDGLTRDAVDNSRLNIDAHGLRCRGMVELDPQLVIEARHIHEACARPVEVVHDDEALTMVLARLGRGDEANAHFDRCLEACEALGITLVPDRLRRAVAPFGIGKAAPRPARTVSGWGALTETEWLVATHVAAGRTNPQVAAELFVSRRTIESHLYRIFSKLDVSNRTELAVVAMAHNASPSTRN